MQAPASKIGHQIKFLGGSITERGLHGTIFSDERGAGANRFVPGSCQLEFADLRLGLLDQIDEDIPSETVVCPQDDKSGTAGFY